MHHGHIFFEEAQITVIQNQSGEARSYSAPDNSLESVGGAHYDLWINQTKVLNDGPSFDSISPRIFAIRIQSGDPPLIGLRREVALPDEPGPPTVVTFDDFLIRGDLPAGAPDSDGDGLADFMEAYFGTNPGRPGASPLTVLRTGNLLTLAWPEADAVGKTALAQWSPDMITWLSSGESLNGVPARTITVTSPSAGQKPASLDGAGAAYLRLKVKFRNHDQERCAISEAGQYCSRQVSGAPVKCLAFF